MRFSSLHTISVFLPEQRAASALPGVKFLSYALRRCISDPCVSATLHFNVATSTHSAECTNFTVPTTQKIFCLFHAYCFTIKRAFHLTRVAFLPLIFRYTCTTYRRYTDSQAVFCTVDCATCSPLLHLLPWEAHSAFCVSPFPWCAHFGICRHSV